MGYGCINPKNWWGGGANGADHQLRVGYAPVVAISSLEFTTKGNSAVCFGDSGAPIMRGNGLSVIGLVSKGNISTTSYLARLDTQTFLEFAKNFMAKNHSSICGLEGC